MIDNESRQFNYAYAKVEMNCYLSTLLSFLIRSFVPSGFSSLFLYLSMVYDR